ncbi:MAG: DUF1376 domain-containing protein [Planctomycetota bacterium]|jgi:uncharacterized protein YdaU (DUF1376 family)
MPKIKYIQLEPAAYATDTEWLMMTAEERGIYHSLIIYLSTNEGRLGYDPEQLCKLCNTKKNIFENFWRKYVKKFQLKNKQIKHKRVTKALRHARKLIKQRSLAGIASGKARSTGVSTELQQSEAKRNEANTKEKEIKRNETKDEKPSDSVKNPISFSLRFADKLDKVIAAKSQSDKLALVNLIHWLKKLTDEGIAGNDIYEKVLGYARDSRHALEETRLLCSSPH